MKDPWVNLPLQPDYVLPADREPIADFNATTDNDHRIHLELLPAPFLGRPNAPVVLLNLNPSFSEKDHVAHADPYFAQTSRANLVHGDLAYPFYLLDPRNAFSSGASWWVRYLRTLLASVERQRLANSLLCVEYFPYHSPRFPALPRTLESQTYSFWLVRRAIEREAVITVLRGDSYWREAVPELEKYSRSYRLRNWQSVWVTEGNCPEGYPEVLRALTQET